jgi:cell division protein FtsQ
MRQVKSERKARGARPKAGRRSARVARIKEAPRQNFGRREKFRDDIVSRAVRRVKGWFSRPILILSGSFLALVIVAALFLGGYVGRTINGINSAVDALIADAGFGIAEVHLAGNARTPPETILAALGFQPGQSIFGADLQAARRRLLLLDWVADADVQRNYPDGISVRIAEKHPFALWQAPSNTLYVVERYGGLITDKNIEPFVHLPLLAGAGGNTGGAEVIDAVAQHRAVQARLSEIVRVSERRWNLILDDGVTVKLPETGWQKELDTLEHLIIDKGILERNVVEIDLRSKANYFFVLKSGEKTNVVRGNGI